MNNVRNESVKELGKYFEQSIIAYADPEKVKKMCADAVAYNMAGVYCSSHEIDAVKSYIEGSGLFLGSAVSFPLGSESPECKAFTADYLVGRGVTNIDFLMNYRALLNGQVDVVEKEVELVRKAAPEAVLKMIIECCYLSDEQIDTACRIAIANRIDFVKSSTGTVAGPTFAQMCRIVDHMHGAGLRAKVAGIKAPRPQNAMVTLLAGVDRIGSQQCVQILDGIQEMRDRGVF